MTIQGAIVELQNLIDVDDVPFYYKVAIKKVIETIQMEMADRKTEPQTSKIIEAYSKGFEDGAEAVKAMPQMGVSYSDHTDYDEPKTYVTWTEPQTERSE